MAGLRPGRVPAGGPVLRCLPPLDGVVDQPDQDQVFVPQPAPLDEPAAVTHAPSVNARHFRITTAHDVPCREKPLARHLRRPDAQGEVPAAREQAAAVGPLVAPGDKLQAAPDPTDVRWSTSTE